MEDISLFSTSAVFEELELFNPLPAIEEDGFLDEYDVYSFIEDPSVKPPTNLLAEDLLQEFEIEGKNHLSKTFLGRFGNIFGLITSVSFCAEAYLFPSRKGLLTSSHPSTPPSPPPPLQIRKQIIRNFVS